MRITQICFGQVGARRREGFLIDRDGGLPIFRSLRGKASPKVVADGKQELCRKESEVYSNGTNHSAESCG